MFSKKILFAIPVIVSVVLAGVIYLDTRDRSEEDISYSHDHENPRGHAIEPEAEDMERILSIEQQLEDMDNESLAIAFYGELIQIYIDNDRLDGAAEAAERMAALTGDVQDWRNAGDWYHEWLLTETDQDYIMYFSGKSAEMYETALTIDPENVSLRTDLAVEYIRLGRAEEAVTHLEKALTHDPGFLEANYNLGVILHQMGNKNKSIAYLKHSAELAEGTGYEEKVNMFLQQNEIQLP